MTGQGHICSASASQPKAVPTPPIGYWHQLFHMPGAKPEIMPLSSNKNASASGRVLLLHLTVSQLCQNLAEILIQCATKSLSVMQ